VHGENFFGCAGKNIRTEMEDSSDPEIDGNRIPRRPDAEAVDLTIAQTFDHIGRRQNDEAHVLIRIDTAGRHPKAELVVVR